MKNEDNKKQVSFVEQDNEYAYLRDVNNSRQHENPIRKYSENQNNITNNIYENYQDNLLDNLIEKTGFNFEHFKLVMLLILYCGGEGFVMIGISLFVPVIGDAWKLSEFQKGFIGGSVFLGFTFGSITAGIISDRKGRKMAFILGNIVSLIGGLMGATINYSYEWIIISNMLVGFGIGISIPSVFSLCSEITNHKIRSNIIGWIWGMFSIGEITGCLIAKTIEMHDYDNHHWKLLLVFRCSSVNINLEIIFSLFFLYL